LLLNDVEEWYMEPQKNTATVAMVALVLLVAATPLGGSARLGWPSRFAEI